MDCSIRPWRLSDAPALSEALNNPRILANLRDGLPFPYTEADAEVFIRTMLDANPDAVFSFAIALDDRAIGSIGAFRQGNIHTRTAELGYYIGEPHWGRGYATCAITQTCQWVFAHTDILRIYAEPFAHNTASCRALEKAGFQYEGTLHQNAWKNGQILDIKMYALLRP
ncbi:MAG: GNAT family N-acetyltransferase [Oscillospiraceae bacterium]|nr:GNAT family N-acetyltransferase [Oscillospiraceae bacterium]